MEARMGEKKSETRKKKDTTTAAWAAEKNNRPGDSMRTRALRWL
jgi:hypothetical protein